MADAESPVGTQSGCDPQAVTSDGAVAFTCAATSAGGTAGARGRPRARGAWRSLAPEDDEEGGKSTLKIKPSKAGEKKLRRAKRAKFVLTLKASGPNVADATLKISVTLKR